MPTAWGPVLLCTWPGLPGLWFRGKFSSLLLAVGFSILLNLALISSFMWPWILGELFPAVAWPLLTLIWTFSAVVAYRQLPDLMSVPTSEKVADERAPDTLFIQAQGEYLRGHWEESASILHRLILRDPRDVEARLLMATLHRHTREFEAARLQLGEIEKFDEAFEWKFEIERERDLLNLIQDHEDVEVAGQSSIDVEDEPTMTKTT